MRGVRGLCEGFRAREDDGHDTFLLPVSAMPNVQRSDAQRSSVESLFPRTTPGEGETLALGGTLADHLDPGAVVALYGELGTGKTQLVKGIAKGLDIPPASVRSPTFTILNTYEEGRGPLYHFDAYRVRTADEFVELGFEEYVRGDGITCIEWADRVEGLLPRGTLRLHLTHVDHRQRRIARRREAGAHAE